MVELTDRGLSDLLTGITTRKLWRSVGPRPGAWNLHSFEYVVVRADEMSKCVSYCLQNSVGREREGGRKEEN